MNLLLSLIFFSLTLWLGLYLVHRHNADPRLGWTGAGLTTYAAGIAALLVYNQTVHDPAWLFPVQFWWLLSLPALFWTGAAIHLLPETQPLRPHLQRFWQYGQLPLVALLAPLFFATGATTPQALPGLLHRLLIAVVLVPLGVIVFLLLYNSFTTQSRRFPALFWVAALFFALSIGALLLPILPIAPGWIILGMGLDLSILGFIIAKIDAFEQGEKFLPDLLLAFITTVLAIVIFGGLVALTMALATGVTPPMLILLFATITAASVFQIFAPAIQRTIDHFVLAQMPTVIDERAELRALADSLPRQEGSTAVASPGLPQNPLAHCEPEEFARLTRRALSQMDDLTKLAANPLTQLPVIEQRLIVRHANDNTLERAQELRALLSEAIAQLKPAEPNAFGKTSAWRYYNALYFTYVVGLKPYSRRTLHDGLTVDAQQALAWFRSQVPERTLYNWQNAAQLVAQYLRDAHQEPHSE